MRWLFHRLAWIFEPAGVGMSRVCVGAASASPRVRTGTVSSGRKMAISRQNPIGMEEMIVVSRVGKQSSEDSACPGRGNYNKQTELERIWIPRKARMLVKALS
ncbi:hypothetical protein FB446DRAFT_739785 [Lentinula raphanica]|nr:hypothetical protein FB446DRAFT_739785 [Lentinula raphanica]